MKTVVIVHHTGEWGGGTKSLIDLCEMLRYDYNVIVCIPRGYPEFAKKVEENGCKISELSSTVPFVNIYSGSPPLLSVVTLRSIKSLKYIKKVGDEILSLEPDIVIFNTLVTAITARYISRYIKVMCIDRETLVNKCSIILYRKLLDSYLNAITFLAEYEKEKINLKKTKAFLFPDCVRLDALVDNNKDKARKHLGIPNDKFVILFMGGLAKIKGPDVIFHALDELDDSFLLVLAGSVDERKISGKQLLHDIKYPSIYLFKMKLRKYYYRLKGTTKLYEVGLRDNIDEVIVASDIIVFPSTSVHQPRPCIEAGAYNKPVVISDFAETREYFKEGYNALTFTPKDANALLLSLQYAYNHKTEMKDLGDNNRHMTETKHDYYQCKRNICSIIERVCSDAN